MKKALWMTLTFLVTTSFLWMGHVLTTPLLPSTEHPIVFYATETKDDLGQAFAKAIQEAKESVHLIIYSLRDRKIIRALHEAAERGIDVQVVCDANGSSGVSSLLGKKVHTTYRHAKGLMHQKILVVDREKIWVGSANMTPTSLKSHGNLVVGLIHKDLANFAAEKAFVMGHEGRISPFFPKTVLLGEQKAELWFFPDSPDGVEKIKSLLRSAKKTIQIAMFTWTRFDLVDEVIKAHKNGIKAIVAIDRNAAQGVGEHVVKRLLEGGVPVYLSQGSELLHHKFLLIDEEILLNGSANWTKAAFLQNDDCFLILSPLTEEQKNKLRRVWEEILVDSERVTRSR